MRFQCECHTRDRGTFSQSGSYGIGASDLNYALWPPAAGWDGLWPLVFPLPFRTLASLSSACLLRLLFPVALPDIPQ